MTVEVVSMIAAVHGNPEGITWRGDVPDEKVLRQSVEATNDRLFRFFNRVDDEDGERLEQMGYRLPSLTMGDYIAWGGRTYRVLMVGFEDMTGKIEAILP